MILIKKTASQAPNTRPNRDAARLLLSQGMTSTLRPMTRMVIKCSRCRKSATVNVQHSSGPAYRAERDAIALGLRARGFKAVEMVHHADHSAILCCGKSVSYTRIAARLEPSHACDDLCRKATGATCVCACGGANHGAAHAI
jgi:hypothetical protein